MKKNRMMRVASGLLVAVLLTTCVISGTFAKYVTTGDGQNIARVAKFGVEIGRMADDLFLSSYKADDTVTKIKNTVVAHNSEALKELVAPGTRNEEGVKFSLTGTPEVAVNIKFELTGTELVEGSKTEYQAFKDVFLKTGTYTDWTQAPTKDKTTGEDKYTTFELTEDYYPVKFTLVAGDTTLVEKGNLQKIKEVFDDMTKDYEANTDLAKAFGDTTGKGIFTLTWEWDFDNKGAGTNDKADTLLGNIAAEVEKDISDTQASTDLDFRVAITVTQID